MSKNKRIFVAGLIGFAAIVLGILFIVNAAKTTHDIPMSVLLRLDTTSQRAAMEQMFWRRQFPQGEEIAFVKWAQQTFPQESATLLRQSSNRIPRLAEFISFAALQLIEANEVESGVTLINLANSLFPEDPDVLGVQGVLMYVSDELSQAEQLLEQAVIWQKNRPTFNFYLGSVLLRSEDQPRISRGKHLFLGLVNNNSARYAETAALILLAERRIPLLNEEVLSLLTFLESINALRPDNPLLVPQDLRTIINRAIRADTNRAIQLTRVLLEHPDHSTEDLLATVILMQQEGAVREVMPLLDRLGQLPLPEPQQQLLERIQIYQLFLQGRFEEGAEQLIQLVEIRPQDPALNTVFAQILGMDNLPLQVEREVLQAFLKLPDPQPALALQSVQRLINLLPLREEEWIRWTAQNLLPRSPMAVSGWLRQIGRNQLILDSLPPTHPQQPNEILLTRTEAYLQLSQWDNAEGALNMLQGRLDSAIHAFYMARFHMMQGDLAEAQNFWTKSHQLALRGSAFPLLKNLGMVALSMDQPQNAFRTLFRALQAGVAFSEPEAQVLQDLSLQQGSMADATEVAAYLLRLSPQNPIYLNNLAYLNFLQNANVAEQVAIMRRVTQEHPDNAQFTITLALGLLRQGRANEAARILQQTRIDWQTAPARSRVVYAAVLSASNQRSLADVLLQNLDRSTLLPQEIALIDNR